MHESHEIEFDLRKKAETISEQYDGAQVIVIVGGSKSAKIPCTMLGSSLHNGERLRDLLGVLEASKQIETLKHFKKLNY